MNAKSRAAFINSVASGQTKSCPNCGLSNQPDSRFCISCGTELVKASIAPSAFPAAEDPVPAAVAAADAAPVFAPIAEKPAALKTEAPVRERKIAQPAVRYDEPTAVFAQGLPDWDIVPPQVMVRRR